MEAYPDSMARTPRTTSRETSSRSGATHRQSPDAVHAGAALERLPAPATDTKPRRRDPARLLALSSPRQIADHLLFLNGLTRDETFVFGRTFWEQCLPLLQIMRAANPATPSNTGRRTPTGALRPEPRDIPSAALLLAESCNIDAANAPNISVLASLFVAGLKATQSNSTKTSGNRDSDYDNNRALKTEGDTLPAALAETFGVANEVGRDMAAYLTPLAQQWIAAQAHPAAKALTLPKAPPKYPYKPRMRGGIVKYLQDNWGPYIAAGVLTQANLRSIDPPAYRALHNWLRQNDLPEDLRLPTKKEAIDREIEALGGEERILHLAGAIQSRARRREP